MEIAAFAGRFAQYVGAALVFGWPLFDQRAGASMRPPLLLGASIVLCGALLALAGQTAAVTGSTEASFSPADLWLVTTETAFGRGVAVRLVLASALIAAAVFDAPQRLLLTLGAAVAASLALTGHAAAGEGAGGLAHQAADALHALAAAAWIGALLVFLREATTARGADRLESLWRALARFSGAGSVIVATLLATGLVNSWFLVGPEGASTLTADPYGRLLLLKLALFVLMILLAAANRFLWTPRLGASLRRPAAGTTPGWLRFTLCAETVAGLCVLAAVAAMGLLPPPAELITRQ
jgi:putative copper resistance protein D